MWDQVRIALGAVADFVAEGGSEEHGECAGGGSRRKVVVLVGWFGVGGG